MLSQENEEPFSFPYLSIDTPFTFPNPEQAQDGVIGYGGNLSPGMLISAYKQGIFPWYNKDDPILWWSPDPRFVLFPEDFHVSKSLNRFIKKNRNLIEQDSQEAFTFSYDKAFPRVIQNCASIKRKDQNGTWINNEIINAYITMFEYGYAHSGETWYKGELVGGFYGILIGQIFFGESMFSTKPNASKSIFTDFVQKFTNAGGKLIDSQVYTDYLASFGARNISRTAFLKYEEKWLIEDEIINQKINSIFIH